MVDCYCNHTQDGQSRNHRSNNNYLNGQIIQLLRINAICLVGKIISKHLELASFADLNLRLLNQYLFYKI